MWSNFFKYGSDLKFLKLYFAEELTLDLDNRKKSVFSLAVPWDLNIPKKAGKFLRILIFNLLSFFFFPIPLIFPLVPPSVVAK